MQILTCGPLQVAKIFFGPKSNLGPTQSPYSKLKKNIYIFFFKNKSYQSMEFWSKHLLSLSLKTKMVERRGSKASAKHSVCVCVRFIKTDYLNAAEGDGVLEQASNVDDLKGAQDHEQCVLSHRISYHPLLRALVRCKTVRTQPSLRAKTPFFKKKDKCRII